LPVCHCIAYFIILLDCCYLHTLKYSIESALHKTVLREGEGGGNFMYEVKEWKWTEAVNKGLPLKGNLVRCLRSLTSENKKSHHSGTVILYCKDYIMGTVYKHSIAGLFPQIARY
jgi:hypothetical protein